MLQYESNLKSVAYVTKYTRFDRYPNSDKLKFAIEWFYFIKMLQTPGGGRGGVWLKTQYIYKILE